MNVFKVPDALASQYHGAGHALAATTGGALIRIVYLSDVLPDYDPDEPGALQSALDDERLGPTVRELQALGALHVGMCSCWEFVEL